MRIRAPYSGLYMLAGGPVHLVWEETEVGGGDSSSCVCFLCLRVHAHTHAHACPHAHTNLGFFFFSCLGTLFDLTFTNKAADSGRVHLEESKAALCHITAAQAWAQRQQWSWLK